MRNLQDVVRGFLACAIWADLRDENGNELDESYSVEDFSPEAKNTAEAICAGFITDCAMRDVDDSDWTDASLGHDLWLTIHGHGAGFWDRGRDAGEALTQIAQTHRAMSPYVRADGKLGLENA